MSEPAENPIQNEIDSACGRLTADQAGEPSWPREATEILDPNGSSHIALALYLALGKPEE